MKEQANILIHALSEGARLRHPNHPEEQGLAIIKGLMQEMKKFPPEHKVMSPEKVETRAEVHILEEIPLVKGRELTLIK